MISDVTIMQLAGLIWASLTHLVRVFFCMFKVS